MAVVNNMFITKLLPDWLSFYYHLDPWEQNSVELEAKYKTCFQENAFENTVCKLAANFAKDQSVS